MRFVFEDRANGLSYIQIFHGDVEVGSFSLATADWSKVKKNFIAAKFKVEELQAA